MPAGGRTRRGGFSLIELLVTVSILSLLVSLLLPSLARARDLAREATCLTRVSGQIKAVHLFAAEHSGEIPVGPAGVHPWFAPHAWRQIASNQVYVSAGGTFFLNAHGALPALKLLSPEMLFCPDDNSADAPEQLRQMQEGEQTNLYCSYLYRQMDEVSAAAPRLDDLGVNGRGDPVRALLLDADSRMTLPGAPVRFNHRCEKANIAFVDASAETFAQPNEEFTLRASDATRILLRLDEILQAADRRRP